MSLADARRVADAVLYEGYVLFPYRAKSLKSQVRWQFGVVAPKSVAEFDPGERWSMQTEVLIDSSRQPVLDVKLRFLRVQSRSVETLVETEGGDRYYQPVASLTVDDRIITDWQEAIEEEVDLVDVPLADLIAHGRDIPLDFPASSSTEDITDKAGTLVGRMIAGDGAHHVRGPGERGAGRQPLLHRQGAGRHREPHRLGQARGRPGGVRPLLHGGRPHPPRGARRLVHLPGRSARVRQAGRRRLRQQRHLALPHRRREPPQHDPVVAHHLVRLPGDRARERRRLLRRHRGRRDAPPLRQHPHRGGAGRGAGHRPPVGRHHGPGREHAPGDDGEAPRRHPLPAVDSHPRPEPGRRRRRARRRRRRGRLRAGHGRHGPLR